MNKHLLSDFEDQASLVLEFNKQIFYIPPEKKSKGFKLMILGLVLLIHLLGNSAGLFSNMIANSVEELHLTERRIHSIFEGLHDFPACLDMMFY